MTFDDWGWPTIYFILGLAALAASWWGQSWRCAYLSILMLMSAMSTDIINWSVNYARAPMIQPECDAIIGVAVAGVALVTRSRVAWLVLGGFVLEAALWVLFFALHMQGTRTSIEVLNALYAALVIGIGIGGAGVRLGLANRLHWGGPGFRHSPFGG